MTPEPESLYTYAEQKDTKSDVCIQPEPINVDISKCPQCGGYADNGFDREYPPNPYFCTKCEKVEGLSEALEYWEREDCIANTLDAKAIHKAARLWLRKQGE